jgi:hypothetical protein
MTTAQLNDYKNQILREKNEQKLDELLKQISKFERLKEEVDEYRQVVDDEHASYGERLIAFEKLNEACEEYECFLENRGYLSH